MLAWYGRWFDRNSSGVIDRDGLRGAGPGDSPLGSCIDFDGVRQQEMIHRRLCSEDPNPWRNGHVGSPADLSATANTTIHLFFFPGNRHASELVDFPGQQVVNWVGREFDCVTPPTCGDIARDDFFGGALLDQQGDVPPKTPSTTTPATPSTA